MDAGGPMTKSRYEGREMIPAAGLGKVFGVFDTFTQTFIVGDFYDSVSKAIAAAGRMNAAYERAMA